MAPVLVPDAVARECAPAFCRRGSARRSFGAVAVRWRFAFPGARPSSRPPGLDMAFFYLDDGVIAVTLQPLAPHWPTSKLSQLILGYI
eukprot:s5717_g3.t1